MILYNPHKNKTTQIQVKYILSKNMPTNEKYDLNTITCNIIKTD